MNIQELARDFRRIEVSELGGIVTARFKERKVINDTNIQELGQELYALIERLGVRKIHVDFGNVDFLSSAALGKLITFDRKVKANGGQLKFSRIRPEIYEVFAITKLNRLFRIHDTKEEALAAF